MAVAVQWRIKYRNRDKIILALHFEGKSNFYKELLMSAEEAGKLTIAELLVSKDPEVQKLVQELLKLLIK